MMTNFEFVEKLNKLVGTPTHYMWGTFGDNITKSLITQKSKQYPNRFSVGRKAVLETAIDKAYAFDCVGMIKGILWGWDGDKAKAHCGASYRSNGVPDTTADGFKKYCDSLKPMSDPIEIGELVFAEGHIGVYAGDDYIIETTLRNNLDGVCKTYIADLPWQCHGKCSFIEYKTEKKEAETTMLHVTIRVNKVGVYVRSNPVSGKVLACCPVGKTIDVLKVVGKASDGYVWVESLYNGIRGYSQYDPKCYSLLIGGVEI